MKRLGITTLIAGVVLIATAGIASASSHGGAPVGTSLVGMMLFEIEHFVIHTQLTFQALLLCLVSPSLGWAMLGDQTLCASVTPLVGLLFGSAWGALATFALTVIVATLFLAWLARKAYTALLRQHAVPIAA